MLLRSGCVVLGAHTPAATRRPRLLQSLSLSLEQVFKLFSSPLGKSDFLAAAPPGLVSRSTGGPEGSSRKICGPPKFFSFGQSEGNIGRGSQATTEA